MVFVIDDDTDVRTAVTRLLSAAGFTVQPYASAEEFLEHEPDDRPGCIVSDLRLPGRDGLDLFAILHASGRFIPMVFISAFADVPSSVHAMKSGAVDFLIKPVSEEALLQSVSRALERDLEVRRQHEELEALRIRHTQLTRREAEVFWFVVEGLLNKQIAGRMGISEQTVKVHRGRVMQKMHADSLAALVHQADRLGGSVAALSAPESGSERRVG
jgi:FixJ family two-component response regulator